MTLTSANSYTTPTLIDQGIVNVRNNASLGLVQSEAQVISFSSGAPAPVLLRWRSTGPRLPRSPIPRLQRPL